MSSSSNCYQVTIGITTKVSCPDTLGNILSQASTSLLENKNEYLNQKEQKKMYNETGSEE